MYKLIDKVINTKLIQSLYSYYSKTAELFQVSESKSRLTLFVMIMVSLAVFIISVNARYDQLEYWKEKKEATYSAETPMMSTLDAYKFIRHARENREGTFNPDVLDTQIFYPDNSPFPDPLPLLSFALDYISRITGADLYTTAINMVPWISSFFILAVCFYFYRIGYSFAGVIAGFVTSFAYMFYGRTSIGRFDTDGMNMCFLFLASIFVYLIIEAVNRKKIFIYSGLLGLTIFLFYRFYHHGMFNIIYLLLLLFVLLIKRQDIKTIGISLGIYILFSSPLYLYWAVGQFIHAINIYIFGEKAGIQALFPNVYQIISEAKGLSFNQVMSEAIIGSYALTFLGLVGVIFFAVFNFKKALPLAPIALLGCMTFISAGRFAMYLAPMVGAGLGYIIYLLTYYGLKVFKDDNNIRLVANSCASAIFLYALIISNSTAYGRMPAPSINPQVYDIFKYMKDELPKGSAIYSWWDYGLAITDVTGFPVYHSGMTQETPKTWMIALSLVSDEDTFYNIASYISRYGVKEVESMAEDNATLADIASRITTFDKGPEKDNTYILFTEDMVGKYGAFLKLAEKQAFFGGLQCQLNNENGSILECREGIIDLSQGIASMGSQQIPISNLSIVRNGKIETSKMYTLSRGLSIIIDTTYGLTVYAMTDDVYNSSFIKMYFLNSFDNDKFDLVYDKYPYGRLYKMKTIDNK